MSEKKSGYAQVTGVLKYNNEVRDEMLRRIYLKDEEYLKYGSNFGVYHEIKTTEVSPITEGKDLLSYTQNSDSQYSKGINHKYFSTGLDKKNYESVPYSSDIVKWKGDYVENFNDNTRLSEIGDATYLQLMTFGNYANTDRHLKDKYITPGLMGFYGSNPSIIGTDGWLQEYKDELNIYSKNSGRIADIPEANIKISKVENYKNDSNNGGFFYLQQNYDLATKYNKEHGLKLPMFGITYHNEQTPILKKNGKIKKKWGKEQYNEEQTFNFHQYVQFTPIETIEERGNIDNLEDFIQYYAPEEIYDSPELMAFEQNTSISLFTKTNELFAEHKIKTLYSKFYDESEKSAFDNGISKHGHSHGRTLLKLDANPLSPYENPFTRNWNILHQYSKVSDLIRPFADNSTIEDVQYMNKNFRSTSGTAITSGARYLSENTVLGENGFVRITPTEGESGDKIKRCMFSIENLAWKDVIKKNEYISKEQQGENGGRIMWFPPYDLDFQENVNVEWDSNAFIGRGEKVYTYKNTDRTGTLSFSLLIDHPSIVNELRGKSGMGNENNLENDILRFFAGERILDLQDKKNSESSITTEIKTDEPKQALPDKKDKIKFYVYFPNHYSGNGIPIKKNEWEKSGYSDLDWYFYLLFGKGTKAVLLSQNNWVGYEMADNGLGIAQSDSKIKSSPKTAQCRHWIKIEEKGEKEFNYRPDFDLKQEPKYDKNCIDNTSFHLNSRLSGNKDISVDANYTFAEVMTALLLKNFSGSIQGMSELTEYEKEKIFVKREEATSWVPTGEKCEVSGQSYEVFLGNDDYYYYEKDGKKINLTSWGNVIEELQNVTVIGKTASYENIKEYVISCGDNEGSGGTEERINTLLGLFKSDTFKPTKVTITSSLEGIKSAKGCTETDAELLAKRRGKAILEVLNNLLLKNLGITPEIGENIKNDVLKEDIDINSKEAKSQRYVCVEIDYNSPEVNKQSDSNTIAIGNVIDSTGNTWEYPIEEEVEGDEELYDNEIFQESVKLDVSFEMLDKYLELEGQTIENYNKERAKNVINFAETIDRLTNMYDIEEDIDIDNISEVKGAYDSMKENKSIVLISENNFLCNETIKKYNEEYSQIPEEKRKMKKSQYKTLFNNYISAYELALSSERVNIDVNSIKDEPINIKENMLLDINDELEINDIVDKEVNKMSYLIGSDKTSSRYETEAEYFSKLKKEDPLVFNSIVEKFKYFSPTFHSISPEGFNARLTFLQQCARQGHTIEANDSKSARNLSFGRMPVCVLRIGDFINTKIIIQSISINYGDNGGIQWDLNPEGAGVQPMYAKVSMSIVILGGQSLEGPISRLQNAVSFDYYANAGVYDNRADRGITRRVGNNGKNITEYNYMWNPYPSENVDNN